MKKTNFDKRLQELKHKYVATNDFDFIAILKLENEYEKLMMSNPEHTRRRNEILRMRKILIDGLTKIQE